MMAICVLLLTMMIAGAAATAEQVEYLDTHPRQSMPADYDHRLSKRMDLEVCIGHFDVHKNTIIRTGESQAIGGKYLQGLELDTIEECERLCCETDACDVYIFERKTGGYCYLFECGPPENFHCKFTRHSNYTSSVLTPQARQTSELASTPRPQLPHIPSNNISQQEWELSNLKLKPEARDKPSVASPAVAPTGSGGSGTGVGVAQAQAVNPVQSVPIAHCSRFQFTCHSGECIAVYNACDGIPQCEDGSDEGPECDAVSSSATKSSGSSSSSVEPVKPMVQQYLPVQQQLQVAAQQQQQQQQQQQPQHVIVLGPPPPPPPPPPMVNNREDAAAWANRKMITEGQQQQPQQQQGGSIATDEQSHIFSHKGLQLQPPSASAQVQGQQAQGGAAIVQQVQGQSTPLQVSAYDSNQAMYGMSLPRSGMYVSQQQQQPLQNPQQQLQAASSGQQMSPNVVWPQQQQQPQLPVQQQPQQQLSQVYAAAAPAPPVQHQTAAMLPVLNAAPAQGKNQAPSADGDYEDYDEETYTEAPKKKQHKHKKVKVKTAKDPIELALEQNKQQQETAAGASLSSATLLVPVSAVHEQYKMIHENLAMEFRDHDGHSERPGGAVLSLTLGLLVTAALAILIGCRMRTVSRRARRLGGKTPYSQEADFLVNGMYL
ncbi:polyglutamine-repeat protein pqn-41 [Drosophila kikkawai]|uniref:Polyglutamine-repeat protein pqn-41 n=1 Tax=Drosophila kikkawai TaxID=30033 RepID=A0A6P4ICA1_DROKI|nr:low-density lipoprotein receptor-related protein 11 [Drosophila kikkawai]